MKSNDEKSAPRMKKHIIVLIVILLTGSAALANYVDMVNALNPASYWRVDDDPIGPGSGGNTVKYHYWSPLTVVENITSLGGGQWQYDYSFTNLDTSPIWLFALYTDFPPSSETVFDNHPGWGSSTYDPSPKFYGYETIASGYTQTNGGYLASVGQTVPEPATMVLLGLGGLALRISKRRP